jgi:predicted nucleic acid-binding protein
VSFLLDTNVLLETVRPRPDAGVLDWLQNVDEDSVFISVASIAEIQRGVALMETGRRRKLIAQWLEVDLPARFEGRLLNIDVRIARAWGELTVLASKSGGSLHPMDGFFAATAAVYDLTLVTRNVRDFTAIGIPLFNPWNI